MFPKSFSSLLLLPFAASASGADCPGDPGLNLTIAPLQVPVGTHFDVTIEAPVGHLVVLLVSQSAGPTPTLYGSLCVGLPAGTFAFVQPAPSVTFPHPIDCNPAYVGLEGHLQFIAAGLNGQVQVVGRSNSQTVLLTDGPCTEEALGPGSFFTFTQGGWGQKCKGGNVGCLRDQFFNAKLPNGLVLGDPDGIDGDGAKAIHLTSSAAVNAFLPNGGPSGKLTQDLLNPTSSPAGALAAQLAAAKLNVAFDEGGVFDGDKVNPFLKLADMVFVAQVHSKLIGLSVAEVIILADNAISGAAAAPFDVDGDQVGDIGYSDLTNALDVLNNNFHEGKVSAGSLAPSYDP